MKLIKINFTQLVQRNLGMSQSRTAKNGNKKKKKEESMYSLKVYLIENYQISWQEMPGYGIFRTVWTEHLFRWLKVLGCSKFDLPSCGWPGGRPGAWQMGGSAKVLSRPSLYDREAGFVNRWAEFYMICSKATRSVSYRVVSAFQLLGFLTRHHCASTRTACPAPIGVSCPWKQDYKGASLL